MDEAKQPENTIENAKHRENSLSTSTGAPLSPGSIILHGRYQILQVLHQRPRVNLYLARRFSEESEATVANEVHEPLVAIRELVLTDLSPRECKLIERAAFEEFVSPAMLGSPRLPGAGDRMRIEGNRHFLVMQLRRARGEQQAVAVTLSELLLRKQQWPAWLNIETALAWGAQLCRIVARLHRLEVILGDLDPETVLVDREGAAEWAPVLLISWPPAPSFWPEESSRSFTDSNSFPITAPDQAIGSISSAFAHFRRIFPYTQLPADRAFAAPEMQQGICDERSDVYSLGALLYLLLTRYAPTAAALRTDARREDQEGMPLILPRLFNNSIPPVLENILLRALALNPAERYPSAFALVEALEAVDLSKEWNELSSAKNASRKASRLEQVIEWLRQELSE